jgi:hypothetical protein
MGISEYENIEIFNNTQSFDINKCENQIIRETRQSRKNSMQLIISDLGLINLGKNREINYIFETQMKTAPHQMN